MNEIIEHYIRRSELRAQLGISDPTLGRRLREHKIAAYRFGGVHECLYRREAVRELLDTPKSVPEPKPKRIRKPRPPRRFQRRAHYDTWEGVIDGYEVIDTQRDEVIGLYPSARHASYLAKKWNRQEAQS